MLLSGRELRLPSFAGFIKPLKRDIPRPLAVRVWTGPADTLHRAYIDDERRVAGARYSGPGMATSLEDWGTRTLPRPHKTQRP
jgi:hypothetical protein